MMGEKNISYYPKQLSIPMGKHLVLFALLAFAAACPVNAALVLYASMDDADVSGTGSGLYSREDGTFTVHDTAGETAKNGTAGHYVNASTALAPTRCRSPYAWLLPCLD